MGADAKGNPLLKADGKTPSTVIMAEHGNLPPLPDGVAQAVPETVIPTDGDGKYTVPAGVAKVVAQPFNVKYSDGIAPPDPKTGAVVANYHPNAVSVISPHNFSFIFIQACIAILILVGFESVTAMGEEAKNPKKDIPKAVVLSLLIQGGFCYLFEYFATNYMIHSGYTLTNAAGDSAPLGSLMQLAGAWAFAALPMPAGGLCSSKARHGVPCGLLSARHFRA